VRSERLQEGAAQAKAYSRKVLTIVGGIHATTLPADYLHPDIDLVCINEGVFAFREVVEHFEAGRDFRDIAGLAVNHGASGTSRRGDRSRT